MSHDTIDVATVVADTAIAPSYSTTGAAGADITAHIDCLNSPGTCDELQADINRDGTTSVIDLTRLIDLFNGANTSRSWIGATLPPHP